MTNEITAENTENNKDIISDDSVKYKGRKPKNDFSKNDFKEKECRIINYNIRCKILDIDFDGYGIRIKNVENAEINKTNTISVKYRSEIGQPDFEIKL